MKTFWNYFDQFTHYFRQHAWQDRLIVITSPIFWLIVASFAVFAIFYIPFLYVKKQIQWAKLKRSLKGYTVKELRDFIKDTKRLKPKKRWANLREKARDLLNPSRVKERRQQLKMKVVLYGSLILTFALCLWAAIEIISNYS